MNASSMQTRRQFLRTTLLGGAMSWTVPSFLHLTMNSLHAQAAQSLTQPITGKDDTILVVLQLAGGNDGLNALVPWSNDHYYRARPKLAIPAGDVMKINDDIGLNPALGGFSELYEAGDLSVVQGVGYPNPNRSHFRSTEIWQTATDSNRYARHGWIGRYFDQQCSGMGATAGIHLTSSPPQSFAAEHPKGVAFTARRSKRRNNMVSTAEDDAENTLDGGSIDMFNGAVSSPSDENPIDFLERTALDAQVSAKDISVALRKSPARDDYPDGRLARDLQQVSRLIAGGMTTRIYYVSQGGYDTHANQSGAHPRLLGELGSALQRFIADLKEQGNLDRVLVMTFSEFGRRVKENANGGTDHGAAAPLFLAGGGVKGGVYGDAPSLDPKDLLRGDLVHTVDFRSVYATVLEKHLRVSHEPILGRNYPLLSFA